jgi:hypothetical protein
MIGLDQNNGNLEGANHDDTFDYSDPLAHRRNSSLAIQP